MMVRQKKRVWSNPVSNATAQKHFMAFEFAAHLNYFDRIQAANPGVPLALIGNGHNGYPLVEALAPELRRRKIRMNTSTRISSADVDDSHWNYVPDKAEFTYGGALNFMLKRNPVLIIADNSPLHTFASAHRGYRNFFGLLNKRFGVESEFDTDLKGLEAEAWFLDKKYCLDNFPNFKGYPRFRFWCTELEEEKGRPDLNYPMARADDVHRGDVVFTQIMMNRWAIESRASKGCRAAEEVLRVAQDARHRPTELAGFGISLSTRASRPYFQDPQMLKRVLKYLPLFD